MKTWTYKEARDKLLQDNDLQDQSFISPNELIGYFNEGIEEAESEILKLDEDYFLTQYPIPLQAGVSAYAYPFNIYGYKLRGIQYSNGTQIYPVNRIRRNNKFDVLATSAQYSQADDYRWYHTNDVGGQARINLTPPSRETAIVPPNANPFTPMVAWYIRHSNRVPLLGEMIPQWDQVVQASGVNAATDQILTAGLYTTGDVVMFTTTGVAPTGLSAGGFYYAIRVDATHIKLAATLQLALAGTAIDITGTGSGVMTISVAANQAVVDATLIDIPEFTKFVLQWVKCRCFEKEGDPRLEIATTTLTQQRAQMVQTLTEAAQDDANLIEPDFSAYNEMT